MENIFTKEKIKLIQADCMDIIKKYPDNYFDLAIVDPQYGLKEHGGANRRGKSKHVKKNWDIATPSQIYFNELERVSKHQIIWGANYFIDKIKKPSMGWICWDKKLDNSDFSDFELAYTSFNRGAKIFRYSKNGGSRTRSALADIIHPTQKPIKLYEWLLRFYAEPCFKILDTHLGSASSAIAAYKYGCEFVGVELDKDYFDNSIKRFKKHTSQTKINFE